MGCTVFEYDLAALNPAQEGRGSKLNGRAKENCCTQVVYQAPALLCHVSCLRSHMKNCFCGGEKQVGKINEDLTRDACLSLACPGPDLYCRGAEAILDISLLSSAFAQNCSGDAQQRIQSLDSR